jgi:hypothetical protein
VPQDSGDSVLLDIPLPVGVDVPALGPLERLGLADNACNEAVAPENSMDSVGADRRPFPPKEGVCAKGTPGGALRSKDEDPIAEVPMGPIGVMEGTSGFVPIAAQAFLSVVSAPAPSTPSEDPENLAYLHRTNATLNVLLDVLESRTNVFPDQCDHPGGRTDVRLYNVWKGRSPEVRLDNSELCEQQEEDDYPREHVLHKLSET